MLFGQTILSALWRCAVSHHEVLLLIWLDSLPVDFCVRKKIHNSASIYNHNHWHCLWTNWFWCLDWETQTCSQCWIVRQSREIKVALTSLEEQGKVLASWTRIIIEPRVSPSCLVECHWDSRRWYHGYWMWNTKLINHCSYRFISVKKELLR